MDIPENKAITPAIAAITPPANKQTPDLPKVVKLASPDGKSYLTSDLAEAAHLHRAHGYVFDDADQRDAILSSH